MYLLQGMGYGFLLSIAIGPITVSLLQAGIEKNFKSGIFLAIGAWSGDILTLLVINWGLTAIISSSRFELISGIIGSIVLTTIGVYSIFKLKNEPPPKSTAVIRASSPYRYYLTGFLINIFNPFAVFFWLTVTTTEVVSRQLSLQQSLLFFTGIIGMIMVFDILKISLALPIKKMLKPTFIFRLRLLFGLMMIGFGIALLTRVLL